MMRDELYDFWLNLIVPYFDRSEKAGEYFEELYKAYTHKSRHYHTCKHLRDMLLLSVEYGHKLESVEVVRFAIFYHDIVYNSSLNNNESKSASIARARLEDLGVHHDRISQVVQFILATKSHQLLPSKHTQDMAYFLDFDLSVLGSATEVYESYAHAIRMEYSQFPDLLYKPGRRKVLQKFLEREHLYFTTEFRQSLEQGARRNLQHELELLS